MTDHRDTRELLELAAVEPDGLDRLEAGDTAEAAAVVSHLAGCPSCLEELARLRRAEVLLRPILAAAPDPALRERTLAYVRAVGVPRDAAPTSTPAGRGPEALRRRRTVRGAAWAASLAAVLVVGLLGGAVLVGRGAPSGNADPAVAVASIARETAALRSAGDARDVVLVDATGAPAGTMVLSPSAGRLVVSAAGLPEPADGAVYQCWVEVGRARVVLGEMWRAGDVSWWSGDVALPAELPDGVRYGVSLVEEDVSGFGPVVLSGEL
jgi:alkylhydroperoxidase family enzyme